MLSTTLPRVPGIEPVDGWVLCEDEYWLSPRTQLRTWFAQRGDERVRLQLSSYFFSPTQERFAWLVRHGFPGGVVGARGAVCPLDDDAIDEAMAGEREVVRHHALVGQFLGIKPALDAAAAAMVMIAGVGTTLIVIGGLV